MSHHPTQSNPGDIASKQQHQHRAPPPQSTPRPTLHQSPSFEQFLSYHPPRQPSGGYYYHAQSSPYPPPPQHQQQQQPHHFSPIPVQAPYPYHHHAPHHNHHGHHGQHHQSPGSTPWPAPPPSSSFSFVGENPTNQEYPSSVDDDKMDTMSSSPEPSSPSPPHDASSPNSADASAASTLSALANAGSAGPLKKRRKMDAAAAAAKTDAASPDKSPCSSPSIKVMESSSAAAAANDNSFHFPSLLHKLLCEGKDVKDKDDTTAISSSVEWLPHGKGWRVLRWDTLCTEVLPSELPQLCEGVIPAKKDVNVKQAEEGSKAEDDDRNDCSMEKNDAKFSDEQWIDAFTWHVKVWGFEEVRVGKDRGSFRHEMFVKDSPNLCNKMRMSRRPRSNSNSILSLTPTYSTLEMIGHRTSSLDGTEHSSHLAPSWRKSHGKTVSSIFKPRSSRRDHHYHGGAPHHHPSHLHVPALASSHTASFADAGWGTTDHHSQHQHYPPPYPPPPPGTHHRSPKTIRFRDELHESTSHYRQRDDAVEITPNPAEASPLPSSLGGSNNEGGRKGFHRGFVSRRGRRPGLISRHSTH